MRVYKITNKTNNKSYIGVTKHSAQERFNQHYYKRFERNTALSLAFLKYGVANFGLETLEENIETYEEAFQKEKEYIAKYDTYKNGYNLTIGGEGSPTVGVSDEEMIESYLTTKSSVKSSKNLGIGENTILRVLKAYNIPLFGSGYDASKRIDAETIYEDYIKTKSIKETATNLGITPATVSRKLKESNYELYKFGFSSKDEEEIVELYIYSNYSMTQLESMIGVGRKVISRILKSNGVVIDPNRNRVKPIEMIRNNESFVFNSIEECVNYIIDNSLVESKINKTVREGISYSMNNSVPYYDMEFHLI